MAKFQVGKTYLDCQGNRVTIICDNLTGNKPIGGIRTVSETAEFHAERELCDFTLNGSFQATSRKSCLDLTAVEG